MAKMIAVKAKDGEIKVPREDNSHRYIGADPVLVERSTYYIRRLAHGELEELNEADTKKLIGELETKAKAELEAEKKAVDEHKAKTEKAAADAAAPANTKGKG